MTGIPPWNYAQDSKKGRNGFPMFDTQKIGQSSDGQLTSPAELPPPSYNDTLRMSMSTSRAPLNIPLESSINVKGSTSSQPPTNPDAFAFYASPLAAYLKASNSSGDDCPQYLSATPLSPPRSPSSPTTAFPRSRSDTNLPIAHTEAVINQRTFTPPPSLLSSSASVYSVDAPVPRPSVLSSSASVYSVNTTYSANTNLYNQAVALESSSSSAFVSFPRSEPDPESEKSQHPPARTATAPPGRFARFRLKSKTKTKDRPAIKRDAATDPGPPPLPAPIPIPAANIPIIDSDSVTTASPLSSSPPPLQYTPEPGVPNPPFPPIALFAASGDELAFDPEEWPACDCAPEHHPFATHGVSAEDWARFLREVQEAGGLKPVRGMIANAAPVAVVAGTFAGMFVGGQMADKALRSHVKSKRSTPAAKVIDDWNRRFFHPRLIDVVIARGTVTYTGPLDVAPPDTVVLTKGKKVDRHVRAYEDLSDDDNDEGGEKDTEDGIENASKGSSAGFNSRAPRRTVRRGPMQFSRALKASKNDKWRLVVSYHPPVL